MSKPSTTTNLTTYLRAGYPGLCIVTPEEVRAEAAVNAACNELGRTLHAWSSTDGSQSMEIRKAEKPRRMPKKAKN